MSSQGSRSHSRPSLSAKNTPASQVLSNQQPRIPSQMFYKGREIYEKLKENDDQVFKNFRLIDLMEMNSVINGLWHWINMGGPQSIAQKKQSLMHLQQLKKLRKNIKGDSTFGDIPRGQAITTLVSQWVTPLANQPQNYSQLFYKGRVIFKKLQENAVEVYQNFQKLNQDQMLYQIIRLQHWIDMNGPQSEDKRQLSLFYLQHMKKLRKQQKQRIIPSRIFTGIKDFIHLGFHKGKQLKQEMNKWLCTKQSDISDDTESEEKKPLKQQ